MSKFTCLVLCVVAVTLNGVFAKFTDEERSEIQKAVKPIVTSCAEAHGVSIDAVSAAHAAQNEESLDPCFMACAFKKAGLINDKGMYNNRDALLAFKPIIKNYGEYEEKSAKCSSVNDKPVTDGEAGCERAKMVLECLFRQNGVELVLGV